MPELPEVEVVRHMLHDKLSAEGEIKSVEVLERRLRFPVAAHFAKKIKGRRVLQVDRRAKYLLWRLSGDLTLLSHLGMTGSWRWQESWERRGHDHLLFELQNGGWLIYNDPRRFGFVDIFENKHEKEHPRLRHLGVEPLSMTDFTPEYLHTQVKKRKAPVKSILMDQKVVVGVGNIYASEALFLAGIKPTKVGDRLSLRHCEQVVQGIRTILTQAITHGGTTFRDFKQLHGSSGQFQIRLQVYDRDGQACRRCAGKVRRIVQAGRSTFLCGNCQR